MVRSGPRNRSIPRPPTPTVRGGPIRDAYAALRRRLRAPFLNGAVRSLVALMSILSWPAAQAFGRFLGSVYWFVIRRDRLRVLAHLEIALPELDGAERVRLGRACMRHNAKSFAELLHLRGHEPQVAMLHIEVVGVEHLAAARAGDRPVLVLTGHCGNWELLSPALNANGAELTAIAREIKEQVLHEMMKEMRAHFGTDTIVRGAPGSARQLLRTLRGGGSLCLLIDQDTRVDGVWVPFFGRPAYTPVGAAEMALRHDAVVLPCFDRRLADGSHIVEIHPPLDLPGDPVAATAMMTRAIEEQIRRVPEQWVWMHRRWRRQPRPTDACSPARRESETSPA